MLSRRNLAYIDGALHVYGYGGDPAEIKAKRYRNASRLFKRNELQRTVFDQLRRSPNGIDTAELTERIMVQKGWDSADSKLRGAVMHKVGNLPGGSASAARWRAKYGRPGERLAVAAAWRGGEAGRVSGITNPLVC